MSDTRRANLYGWSALNKAGRCAARRQYRFCRRIGLPRDYAIIATAELVYGVFMANCYSDHYQLATNS
jgi:hypothetical protein